MKDKTYYLLKENDNVAIGVVVKGQHLIERAENAIQEHFDDATISLSGVFLLLFEASEMGEEQEFIITQNDYKTTIYIQRIWMY